MLTVVIGTRAQTIKMAPVLRELEQRDMPYRLLLTGQHKATIPELLREFEIRTSPIVLYDGEEVSTLSRVLPWAIHVLRQARATRSECASGNGKGPDIYLVHGDTFSTLVGIRMARREGALVAHVESGLRSYNWRNPFPEEIVRILALRFSNVGFAPGKWAYENLSGHRLRVVDTRENTLIDAVRFACERNEGDSKNETDVVVSIHRFETLYSDRRLKFVVDFVGELAEQATVTFVLHPATEVRLEQSGLRTELEGMPNVTLRPRMTYLPFLQLAGSSKLVVTDGGSNQEELSYLSVPTIVLRNATERQEGIGDNAILGRFDRRVMTEFASQAISRPRTRSKTVDHVFPSKILVEDLRRIQEGHHIEA